MEIKRGISQMAEYPNQEINYVVPEDGKMYYVLRDGVLANGCVIATLDPKRAIDEGVVTDNIGVFKEDGTVLVDFNKKEIKKVNDDFLLVVNSIPTSEYVINALKNENDEISKTMMKDNSTTIVDKMMIEMGITGEILFSDAYSEANIYKMDTPNHKIGPDSSFIGKNDTNFYFHTNDATEDTVLFSLTGEPKAKEESGFTIPDVPVSDIPTEINPQEIPETPVTDANQVTDIPNVSEDTTADIEESDLKLDISQNILDGFKPIDEKEEISNIEIPQEIEEDKSEIQTESKEEEPTEIKENSNSEAKDEVLDNVISVMKKMIEETNKLNDRISELESQLDSKNKLIEAEESKKTALSSLLDEANEILENID